MSSFVRSRTFSFSNSNHKGARFKPTCVVNALFREVQDAVRERLLKVICHTPNCVADAFFCEVQDVQLQ